MESRAGFMALKEQQKLEKELTGYVEWICRAGEEEEGHREKGWKQDRRSKRCFAFKRHFLDHLCLSE